MREVLMENCSSGSFRHTTSITWESFRHYGAIVTALLQVSSLLSWIIGREDNRDALQDKGKMDNLSKWIILETAEQIHSSASIKHWVQESLLTGLQSQVCYSYLAIVHAIAWLSEVPSQQGDCTSHCLLLSLVHRSCPAKKNLSLCNGEFTSRLSHLGGTNKNTQVSSLRQL